MCWYIKQVSVKAGNKTQKAQNHPPKPQVGPASGVRMLALLTGWSVLAF
jgi:hypothetical protein